MFRPSLYCLEFYIHSLHFDLNKTDAYSSLSHSLSHFLEEGEYEIDYEIVKKAERGTDRESEREMEKCRERLRERQRDRLEREREEQQRKAEADRKEQEERERREREEKEERGIQEQRERRERELRARFPHSFLSNSHTHTHTNTNTHSPNSSTSKSQSNHNTAQSSHTSISNPPSNVESHSPHCLESNSSNINSSLGPISLPPLSLSSSLSSISPSPHFTLSTSRGLSLLFRLNSSKDVAFLLQSHILFVISKKNNNKHINYHSDHSFTSKSNPNIDTHSSHSSTFSYTPFYFSFSLPLLSLSSHSLIPFHASSLTYSHALSHLSHSSSSYSSSKDNKTNSSHLSHSSTFFQSQYVKEDDYKYQRGLVTIWLCEERERKKDRIERERKADILDRETVERERERKREREGEGEREGERERVLPHPLAIGSSLSLIKLSYVGPLPLIDKKESPSPIDNQAHIDKQVPISPKNHRKGPLSPSDHYALKERNVRYVM
jgi:hypothetical protein